MADTIDSLQIEINAKAVKANDAIDRLVGKLDRLTTSLSRVNGTNLNGLANGVQRLGNAMQVMNTVKTADFTRLATNLTKLGTVNVSALNSAASSMSHLTRAFNSLGTVSANAQAVGEMAKNIAKLGNKSVQTAIANIPQLAAAMNNLMTTLSRSPQVSQNIIQMTNALANLASQGSRVGTASNSMVRGLNRTSTSANTARKSFGGLASAIGKFYATYFMVIRGLKGLWSSIESTADYIEAFNYYTVSFGKIASKWDSEWENYADENARNYANSFVTTMNETFKKLSGVSFDPQKGLISESGLKNLGLNIKEVTQYAAQLASMMDAVGQSGETTLATTNAFVKLAGDISSLYNIDYSEAANKIRSVLQGQSRAGYGFGWDTTMASLQATADKLNLSKAVNEMSQMEKQQLRILTILQQSRVAWGDQSNTINTLANQIRIFKNNIKEVAMTLGQLFVPILTKIMPIINGIAIAIKNLMASIAGFFGIKIEDIGQGFSDLEDDLGGVSDGLDDVASSAKKAKAGLRAFDELKTINMPDTSGSGASGVGGGGIDLTDEILKATAEYEKAWQEAFDRMESKAQEFANKFEKIFEPIKKFAINIIEKINLNEFSEVLSNLIKNLKGIPNAIGIGLITFIKGLVNIGSVAIVGINLALEGLSIVLKLFNIDYDDIAIGLGALFTSIVAFKAIVGIESLLKGISGGFSVFFSAITAHPYATIAAAIIGIATAISGFLALSDTAEEDALVVSEAVKMLIDSVNDSISSIEIQKQEIEAQYGAVRSIADEYFELADNFDALTEEEKALLQTYAQMLVDEAPELAGSIDTVTGAFTGQKEEVYATIDSLEKYARQLAMQEILKDLYKDQINLEIAIKNNSIAYDEAREKISKYLEEATRKTGSLTEEELQQYLATSDLIELYDMYNDIISRNGDELAYTQEEINTLIGDQDALQESMKDSERAIKTATETIKESARENSYAFKESSKNIKSSISSVEDKMQLWSIKSKLFGSNAGKNASTSYIDNFSKINSDSETILSNLSSTFSIAGTSIGSQTGQNIAESMAQSIENNGGTITSKLSSIFSGIKGTINMVGSMFGINIDKYALGGMPSVGDLFIANEAGPELIGTIGGKTAVASNREITGITDAIYDSMSQEMELMREQNQLLRGILNKNFGITENDIGKAAHSYAVSYKNRTGRQAYT